MDLSDGSDAEEETQGLSHDVNEDDLLEASDEEETDRGGSGRRSLSVSHSSKGLNINDEELLYSDEDEEVLDLQAGDEDDELGLNENDSVTPGVGIAPVKVPIRTAVAAEEIAPVVEAEAPISTPTEEFESQAEGEGESQLDESNVESEHLENSVVEDEDDDEDEDKTQRSRFHSERNPITVPASSGGNSNSNMGMGKPQPIRSLGHHNIRPNMQNQNQQGQRNRGPQNGPRQFHRGYNNHRGQQRFPPHMMQHRMHMQQNGMLGPRPEQNHQFPGPRGLVPLPGHGHPSDNVPVLQFNSQIFTDFSAPVGPPGPIPNTNKPNPQGQVQGQTPSSGAQIPTVQVSPVARPGVGIVRPQPVVSAPPAGNASPNKLQQAPTGNQNQGNKPRPRGQTQNNPFFPPPQNQGPRGASPTPAWRGSLRPPQPQPIRNQVIPNQNQQQHEVPFQGPRPQNAFVPPGQNQFGPPGVRVPLQNLQPPGAESGPPMNAPMQGFGGPNMRPPIVNGNGNPFLGGQNRPFMGPQGQGQGPPAPLMQPGTLPVQPRHPLEQFSRQNAPRLMGHNYPPDPEFRPPLGQQRPPCPDMYNMVPPPNQQFGPRFGGPMQMQEPLFYPGQQPNMRHPLFMEQQQQPHQFHPADPAFMFMGQGAPGVFPPHPQQFQQHGMPPMNHMNQSVQALNLNSSYPNHYAHAHGGNQPRYEGMDRCGEDEYDQYGYKISKRKDNKTLSEEFIALTKPGKRLHDRLGPPPASRKTDSYNHDQADEIVKIIVETKKEMGIDDDYMKQIEEQKRKRAEILRMKAERWRSNKDEDSSASRPKQSRLESPRSESRGSDGGAEQRKSIYINPAAFKGDLSVLNNNLKKINMSISSDSMAHSGASALPNASRPSQAVSTLSNGTTSSQARARPVSTAGRAPISSPSPSPKERPKKPKTILRVTKNKRGEVIHMEKLLKVEKTTNLHSHHHHK